MVDSLGYRAKFAVLAPSTNTVVQPEFDAMRPPGVTNHFSRIFIPNNPVKDDRDFLKLMDDIRAALMQAVENAARKQGRWLLVLDTVKGGEGERVYTRLGWQRTGVIPDYALFPDGRTCATTIFFKSLL